MIAQNSNIVHVYLVMNISLIKTYTVCLKDIISFQNKKNVIYISEFCIVPPREIKAKSSNIHKHEMPNLAFDGK